MKAKADFYCTVCGKEIYDYPLAKKPPVCCRKIMKRKWTLPGIVYRGDWWTGAQRRKR